MGRSRYKIYEEFYPYFITSSIVKHYPVFIIPKAAEIVLESFRFFQEERQVKLNAYVIMKNHIHFIAQGTELKKKVRLFKSFTARKIIDLLKDQDERNVLNLLKQNKLRGHKKSEFQLWQEGYHPKQITDDEMLLQKMEYIHLNPVKKGYVERPEDWELSSARNYVGKAGLIPITKYGEET